MEEYIKNPVELKFDPFDEKTTKEVKSIFENRLARTLWMGIKQGHIMDQYFERQCLNVSEIFEKLGVPDTPEKLKRILEKNFNDLYNSTRYNKKFIEELLSYLSGEKDLEYKVIK
jgi:hypothetical protein